MTKLHTHPIARRAATLAALAALIVTLVTTFSAERAAVAAPPTHPAPAAKPADVETDADDTPDRVIKKVPRGKININTATEDQLMLLPGVGPAKAERIVSWRKKNGGFKRVADLRKVKGFGYKTLKKLEPWLDIKGDTTLAAP